MALSDPRVIFGVHAVTPYNRTTGAFYGTVRVLGGSSLSLAGELIKLNGGSLKYPWAVEDGSITAEMSLKIKEYPDFLFELFLGKAPTAVGVDTAGVVSTPVEIKGTSVIAATGLASISVIPTTGAANLKFGSYLIKATDTDELTVYVSSDIDFARGSDASYVSDSLDAVAPITISTGANTDVASLGLRFVGGASATSFTIGDTASFQVLPPSTKSSSVLIGGTADVFPEFGAFVYAKQRGNGEMTEIQVFKAKAVGLPLGFEENKFSEAEIKAECFYDSAQNAVMKMRHISPA